MNIWEENKIAIFIAFVVPGFIALKLYEVLSPSPQNDSSKKIVDAITYSCINYGFLSYPIYLVEKFQIHEAHPNLYFLFYSFVLFISPVLLVFAWKKIRELEFVQEHLPHPIQKPWDYVFSKRKTYWVIVNLKNGEKIAGMYGLNSFASSAPAEEQIYLEEHWLLNEDKGFERPVNQTSGIIILTSEILSVELINSGETEDEQENK